MVVGADSSSVDIALLFLLLILKVRSAFLLLKIVYLDLEHLFECIQALRLFAGGELQNASQTRSSYTVSCTVGSTTEELPEELTKR